MSNNLLGASANNKTGHWESKALYEFNNQMLSSKGRFWFSWGDLENDCKILKEDSKLRSSAINLIAAEKEDKSYFAVKDPRMCILFPFWRDVLENDNYQVNVLLPIRSPFEVSESLFNRNKITPTDGLFLWLRYVLDSEQASRGLKRSFVNYDSLLTDWRNVYDKLSKKFELLPLDSNIESEIDSFLNPSYRHHKIEAHIPETFVESVALKTFKILSSWAEYGEVESDFKKLDEIKNQFDLVVSYVDPLSNELRASLSEIQVNKDLMKRKIKLRDLDIKEMKARMQENIESKEKQITVLSESMNILNKEMSEKNKIESILIEQLETFKAHFNEQKQRNRVLDKELDGVLKLNKQFQKNNCLLSKENARFTTEIKKVKKANGLLKSEVSILIDKFEDEAKQLEKFKHVNNYLSMSNQTLKNSIEWKLYKSIFKKTFSLLRVLVGKKAKQRNLNRLLEVYGVIAESGLFAANWYLTKNPDVQEQGCDPLTHFIETGARENRDPNPDFSIKKYNSHRPDVYKSGINPLYHYIVCGQKEEFESKYKDFKQVVERSNLFDSNWYLAEYPDVKAEGLDPLRHYLEFGWKENRLPFKGFKGFKGNGYHRKNNISKNQIPLIHFIKNLDVPKSRTDNFDKQIELVKGSALFNATWYEKQYPDVKTVDMSAAEHYVKHGGFEFRDPGPGFSSQRYLIRYQDVAKAKLNPLCHYILTGKSEGRKIEASEFKSSSNGTNTFSFEEPAFKITKDPEVDYLYRKSVDKEHKLAQAKCNKKRGDAIKELATFTSNFCKPDIQTKTDPGNTLLKLVTQQCLSADERLACQSEGFWESAEYSVASSRRYIAFKDIWCAGSNTIKFSSEGLANDELNEVYIEFYQYTGENVTELATFKLGIYPKIFSINLINNLLPIFILIKNRDEQNIENLVVPFPSLYRGGMHFSESKVFCKSNSYFKSISHYSLRLLKELLSSNSGTILVDDELSIGHEVMLRADWHQWLKLVFNRNVLLSTVASSSQNESKSQGEDMISASQFPTINSLCNPTQSSLNKIINYNILDNKLRVFNSFLDSTNFSSVVNFIDSKEDEARLLIGELGDRNLEEKASIGISVVINASSGDVSRVRQTITMLNRQLKIHLEQIIIVMPNTYFSIDSLSHEFPKSTFICLREFSNIESLEFSNDVLFIDEFIEVYEPTTLAKMLEQLEKPNVRTIGGVILEEVRTDLGSTVKVDSMGYCCIQEEASKAMSVGAVKENSLLAVGESVAVEFIDPRFYFVRRDTLVENRDLFYSGDLLSFVSASVKQAPDSTYNFVLTRIRVGKYQSNVSLDIHSVSEELTNVIKLEKGNKVISLTEGKL
ncbi:hypothetical protein [Psychrosphaera haliotis]|uniref:Uncharacterized protein n=1 Tax=Psychrosphaera haliotis TaxID=555083 RepID=A0A6N8FAD0_9GAMM|nr:hypothetical protein [Psychrosphaera haliotis]MUH71381.1 hypothetical protein [Psychrosphaera haliotis]